MSEVVEPVQPVVEAGADACVEAPAHPPLLFDLPLAAGRKAVDDVQSGQIAEPAVDEE